MLRRFWESITEPRHLKVTFLFVYVLVVFIGVATMVAPVRMVEGTLGGALAATWSAFLIVGGIGGAVTVLPGWWWAERLSIVLIEGGIAIYGVVVLGLQLTTPQWQLQHLGFVAIAAACFLIRWLMIRKFSFEPQPRG